MYFKAILYLCVAVTLINAVPVTKYMDGKSAEIITYNYKPTDNGGYAFEYSTSDGAHRKEEATFHQAADPEHESFLSIDGEYSYIGSDGNKYTVVYHADENGYHPVDSSIQPAGTF